MVEPWLTQLLQEKIINNWEAQDEPAHLRNIRDRLLQKDEKNRARLLGVYQRILHTGGIPADGSSEQMELRLSGAVVQREGVLRPYNPIYAQVFGEQWVSAQLAAVRPYSEALQGWLGSAKQEASFLLRGQALQEAETWAQDKSLSDEDYRFLQASQALAQKEVERSLRAKAQKRLILVLAVALVVAVGLTVWAFSERQQAESERQRAQSEQQRAESERQHAQQVEQMRTESLFDSQLTHASLLAKGGVEDYAAAREVLNESRPLDPEVDPARRHARNLLAGFVNLMGGTADKVYEGTGVPLYAVAVSPDGRLVAATGEKGTVVLFDAESGQLVKRLEGHDGTVGQNGSVWTVVFQPQGQWLATAGEDQRIILWHLTEKPPSASDWSVEKWLDWQAPARVNALAISPDGQLLVSGGVDNNISVWAVAELEAKIAKLDAESARLLVLGSQYLGGIHEKPLRTLTGHTERISVGGLAFSPDGTQLASASYDDTARVWDVATGKELQTLRGHTNDVQNIAFSPDGQQLATSSDDKTVRLWNPATSDESLRVLAGHQNAVFGLRFTAAGNRLISASFDRTLRVWDPDTGVTVRVLQGHTAGVGVGGIALHGDSLFSASNDGTVRRWGVGLNRSPNLTGLEDLSGFMKVMDLPTEPASVAIAPDGHSLVVGFADGALRLYALPEIRLLWEREKVHDSNIYHLAFNFDGTLLATAGFSDKTAKLWQIKDDKLTEKQTFSGHAATVFSVAFSPDSTLLATASYDGQIGVFTLGTEKQRLFKAHDGNVASVTFDDMGTRLLSSGIEDFTIRLWTLTTDPPKLLREFPRAQDKLLWATLSPDQQWVASVGRGLVTLYNATEAATVTPPVPQRLVGHEQAVLRAIFSPDSSQLATVSTDATVKLWAVKTGKELFTLRLPTNSGYPVPLWDFDFRCVPQGNCWIAVPLTRGQLALYNLDNYE